MSVEDLLGQIQENLLQAVTLGGKEDVLREALSASYGQLGQNERLMFEVCGAFPLRGTVVTRFPAVAGLPLYHCRGALQRLDRLALVEVDERENRDQNIYHMHQVIHAFAREQLVASETRRLADGAAPSETLLGRLISLYVEFARDHRHAFDQLELERLNLIEARVWAEHRSKQSPQCHDDLLALHNLWYYLSDWLDGIGEWTTWERFIDSAIEANRQLDNTANLAQVLTSRSSLLARVGKADQALRVAREAVKTARVSGDALSTVRALAYLAQVLLEEPDGRDEGHALLEEAWSTCQALPVGEDTSFVGYLLGVSHERRNNVRDAFSFYRRSLDQARETGARRYQAYALAAIGLWFDNHGDSHQALIHLRESLEVREQQGNRAMIAQGLRDLARVVRRTDAARARDLLTRAEQLYKQMTMLLGRIEVLLERSEIYLEERQFDQAIQDLTTALQLGEQLGAAAFNVRVDVLLKLGGAYDAEGQPVEADGAYQHALALSQSLKERGLFQVAMTKQAIGLSQVARGDRQRAEQHFVEARGVMQQYLEYCEQREDNLQIVTALQELIDLAIHLGDHDSLDPLVTTFLDVCRRQELHRTAAMKLHNIAAQLRQHGQVEHAITYWCKAVEAKEQLADRRQLWVTLLAWAQTVFAAHHHDEAEQLLQRCADLVERHTLPARDTALTYQYQGRVREAQADYQHAFESYMRALEAVGSLGEPQFHGVILHDIGDVLRAQGDLEQALTYYQQARAAKEQGDNRRDLAVTLLAIADVAIEQNDLTMAHDVAEQGLALLRGLPETEGTEATVAFLSQLADLAWRSEQLDQARTYLEQARISARTANDFVRVANGLLELLARPKEAIALLEKGDSLSPDDPNVLMQIARCHEALGRSAQALEVYNTLVHLLDGQATSTSLRRLAWTYYKQGRLSEARQLCMKVQAPERDTERVRAGLISASIAWLVGEHEGAAAQVRALRTRRLLRPDLIWEVNHDIRIVARQHLPDVDIEPFVALLPA